MKKPVCDCNARVCLGFPGGGHEQDCILVTGWSQAEIDRAGERAAKQPVLCGHIVTTDHRYICTRTDNHHGPHHGTDIRGTAHTWTSKEQAA